MNLFKRCSCADDGKCRHHFWYQFMLHRRLHRGSTHTARRILAQQIAEKRHVSAVEGREGFRRPAPVRLSDHVNAYVAHTAKKNISSYKDAAVLERFLASVGDRLISEVSAFHVERWKGQRVEEVSRSTVNRELNIVRGCFSRAVDWGRLGTSPMSKVKPYRVDNIRLRVCLPEEIKILLDGAPKDLRLLARLTLESLPRLSEALRLRREDIGPTYATIIRTKNGKARRVPLTAELRSDLLARCHASGYIFGKEKDGRPHRAAAVSVAFSRLIADLGLTGISHHTFRHTGATVMVANGVSLRAVQEIGGWSTLRMVERYAHVDDAELARAVRVTHNHTEASIAKTITGAKASGLKSDGKTGGN